MASFQFQRFSNSCYCFTPIAARRWGSTFDGVQLFRKDEDEDEGGDLDQNELEHDYSWNNDVMRGRMRRSVRGDPGSIRNM